MCRAHRAGEAISAHAVDAPSRSVFRSAGAALPKGDLYAAQAVEDEAGQLAFGSVAGPGRYHRYKATLNRTCGNKIRAEMTLAELAAAIGWMERTVCLSACVCSMKTHAMHGQRASAMSGNRRWDGTSDHQAACEAIRIASNNNVLLHWPPP